MNEKAKSAPSTRPVTVLIAEPQTLFREAMQAMIETTGRYRVVATAADGPGVVSSHQRLRPDIVLMRAELPGLNGADATQQILRDRPDARVIIVASDAEAWTTSAAFDAGARACLLTSCPGEALVQALDAVACGTGYICPRIIDRVSRTRHTSVQIPNAVPCPPPPDALTPKEREVLQLVAEGHATKEIAGQLEISHKTVETHRTNITRKLGLRNVSQMTRYAIRHSLAAAGV